MGEDGGRYSADDGDEEEEEEYNVDDTDYVGHTTAKNNLPGFSIIIHKVYGIYKEIT